MSKKTEAIRARLSELEQADGLLTPQAVVEAAMDPEDVLHGEFDWNDSTAAHAHRLEQARRLIRKVSYRVETVHVEMKLPKYASVELPNKRRGYLSLDNIKSDADVTRQLFADELKRCKDSLERARGLADELGFADELEQALRYIVGLEAMAA